MPQAVAHGTEFSDRAVQFIGLVCKALAVDVRLPLRPEHLRNLLKRETGGAAECDQREPLQHARIEHPAQPRRPTDAINPFSS